MKNYKFLFTGKWILSFILCVLASLLCVYLANWQMGRKVALDHKNNLITTNFDAQPVELSEVPGAFEENLPDDQWKPVILHGHYDTEKQLLVRNRPYNGLNGYEVLVPFEVDGGPIVLIDRGWMEAGFGDATKTAIDVPAAPTGEVTVTARIHSGEADTGKTAPDGQVSSIYLPEIASTTGLNLATQAYGLLESEEPAPASSPIVMDKPDLDTGPNLSYSVQWYVFAAGCYIAYFWSARQKVRNDEIDAQVTAELNQFYRAFYDENGNYTGDIDEDIVVRKMEMVDDMPSHMKSIVRPKVAKKRKFITDEEAEDAYLDSLENN